MQFNMNLIGTCCNALVAWTAVTLEDRMPRRRVLVWGTLLCSLMLAANAGFSAAWATYQPDHENLNVGRAGAAFFCKYTQLPHLSICIAYCLLVLFNVVYAFTVRARPNRDTRNSLTDVVLLSTRLSSPYTQPNV